jgi:hypothetical protein
LGPRRMVTHARRVKIDDFINKEIFFLLIFAGADERIKHLLILGLATLQDFFMVLLLCYLLEFLIDFFLWWSRM